MDTTEPVATVETPSLSQRAKAASKLLIRDAAQLGHDALAAVESIVGGAPVDVGDSPAFQEIERLNNIVAAAQSENTDLTTQLADANTMIANLRGSVAELMNRPTPIPPPVAHASGCAVHNAPAMDPGACDCGATSAPATQDGGATAPKTSEATV